MAEFIEYDWRNVLAANELASRQGGVRLDRRESNDKKAALQTLKDLVGASIDLALRDKSRCQDDRFLERFLYARKHDVREAFRLLINYYSYRQRNAGLFRDLSIKDEGIALALGDGLPGVLRERDRKGRCVIVMFASNWSPEMYSLTAVYRALLLTLEKALDEIQNQANGFVVVVDWTEFSFKQSSNMNPKILKLMIEGLQDCFPARFKGIHFIAQPWYVETALTVIKPFLKGKTKERIRLHGNNLSTLHEYVTKDILPSDLGGEGPSHNTEDWLAELCPSQTAPVTAIRADGPLAPVAHPAQSPARRPSSGAPQLKPDEDSFEKVKIDKGYKKSEGFSFLNNNGVEKSAKTQLLDCEDELLF